MKNNCDIGVIGLGVMGANLARNAARNNAKVAIYNRTQERVTDFIAQYAHEGTFVPSLSIRSFVQSIATPRAILLMVKAGQAVDDIIAELLPHLAAGDILIDAGNSHFTDTEKRVACLAEKGIHCIGMGVSGGEEGALHGPSMMPGGAKEAVKKLLPLFKKMSASDGNGGRCVSYVGEGGSGHFVKMVHNGIEYSLMQAIAETYDFLRSAAKYSNKDLHRVFSQWSSKGDLRGYLMEITADIFLQKDEYSKHDLLDVIADTAAQKGTGKWTTETAMSVGVAVPCINAAVDARILSGAKDLRLNKRKMLKARSIKKAVLSKKEAEHIAKDALSLTYLTCYAQGFELMARVSMERNWNIDLSEVARLWRGGCIIRSALLPELQNAHRDGPMGMKATKKLFQKYSGSAQKNWRGMLVIAISKGVPMPVHCAAIAFFDSLCKERLPQNLIQAQRDYFGSHTYQRIDRPGTFHTVWSHTI